MTISLSLTNKFDLEFKFKSISENVCQASCELPNDEYLDFTLLKATGNTDEGIGSTDLEYITIHYINVSKTATLDQAFFLTLCENAFENFKVSHRTGVRKVILEAEATVFDKFAIVRQLTGNY